ncbi:hypothetical protein NC652_013167 [Populus alba x Populus x berolinensis]|nr:hypothetical protein NC652_013167 [Populus alba x Populus x berolinensis]
MSPCSSPEGLTIAKAFAYAWRMAGSFVGRLTVLHFRLGEKAKSTMEEVKESENDEQLDDKYVKRCIRYEIDSDDQTPTKCGFKAPEQIRCLHESLQKLCFLEENQSNVLMRELGRLNELRRLDIVKFRKRAGRALCSSIEMLINLRPLSVSAIRKGRAYVKERVLF